MSYLSTVVADAPRHYWRCADPGGSLLYDLGSHPKALTFAGSPPIVLPYAGPNSDGGSAFFNGASSAWWLTGETLVGPVSVECWFWQAIQGNPATQYLIDLQSGTTVLLAAYIDSASKLNAQGSGVTRATAGAAHTEQAWHHVVATVDAAGTAKLYLDAINVATASTGAGGSLKYVIAVGSIPPTANNWFAGFLSEIATYDVVLTPTQVNNHFIAADSTTSKPVWRGGGNFSTSTGSTDSLGNLQVEILNSVRKVY